MDLAQILAPIHADVEEVERRLAASLASDLPVVAGLVEHLSQFRGKRLRPAVLLLTARATETLRDEHYALSVIIELIHAATLVHDDVLDEALIRRKVPSLNAKWDNEMSVIFGDWLFARAFAATSALRNHDATLLLSRTAAEICEGEMLQISHKFNDRLREEEYYRIIGQKTASLFEACGRFGLLFDRAHPSWQEEIPAFAREVGVAFQIMDDCLDLMGTEAEMGKSLGTDLTKGKPTLPIIRLLATVPPAKRDELRHFLFENGHPEHRREVHSLLVRHGAIEYALTQARELVARARGRIRSLGAFPHSEVLESLADYVLQRSS